MLRKRWKSLQNAITVAKSRLAEVKAELARYKYTHAVNGIATSYTLSQHLFLNISLEQRSGRRGATQNAIGIKTNLIIFLSF